MTSTAAFTRVSSRPTVTNPPPSTDATAFSTPSPTAAPEHPSRVPERTIMPDSTSMTSSSSATPQQRGPHKMLYNRKIAVMGYPCVGKSSITLRFVFGTFPDAYDTTIEDFHSKRYTYKGREYELRITDTAGQQEYSIFPRSCSVDIDGFILVYAIDDRKSFEIIRTIHDKIVESVGEGSPPIVVVGNKLDLQYASRAISKEEGEALAKQWGAAFIEMSAKDLSIARDSNVNSIFDRMILAIEVAKGNLQPNGQPVRPQGSRKEGGCSLQ